MRAGGFPQELPPESTVCSQQPNSTGAAVRYRVFPGTRVASPPATQNSRAGPLPESAPDRIPGKTLIHFVGPTASVAGVNRPEPPALCFLVEWYRSDLANIEPDDIAAQLERGAAAVSAKGAAVQGVFTVAAPTDDVLYSVFAADSADAVVLACRQAGWLPDRITADIHTHVTRAG